MRELLFQNWVFIATGFFIALVGVLIQKLRLYSLIAGYNTASGAIRKKVNIGLVAIALRNASLIIGAIWIFIPIVIDLSNLNSTMKIMFVLLGHIGITIWLVRNIGNNEKYEIKSDNKQ